MLSPSAVRPIPVPKLFWRVVLAILILFVMGGCRGPGDVRFENDSCYVDGRPANLNQVEQREATVAHRIGARQPCLVAITVVVVSLAGVGYLEKLVLLFSASRGGPSMGDRLRALVDRYRAHPVRYVSLVAGTFGLLVLAGALYIYFDADKRVSERALATLQFCHLALRTGDEKRALDDQRRNLASLHDTAGEIRQLIDMLPPAEKAKAHQIVGHMDEAVRREGRLIADHLQRSEDTAQAIRDGTQSIARDLSGIGDRISGLSDVPVSLRAVSDGVRRLEAHATTDDHSLAEVDSKLTSLQRALDTVASRPLPSCPACVCSGTTLAAVAGGSDASAR